MDTVVVSHHN